MEKGSQRYQNSWLMWQADTDYIQDSICTLQRATLSLQDITFIVLL